jgi:N-acyl-L-homoserine lactone synthetase
LGAIKEAIVIYVIDSLNKHDYQPMLEEMYRLRKRVFHDRLGWDVEITDGMEIDIFDSLDPSYIVSVDSEGQVVGCVRQLQTTGPHMLSDVFSSILDGEPPLRSSRVWEATRFCVDTQRLSGGRGRNTISYVTSEIMIAAIELAILAGVTDAIAVVDPVMNRVLHRSGNGPYDYLGTPKQMGKVVAMAGLIDCTPERAARIRAFSGIEGNIFAQQDMTLAAE